MPDTVHKIGNTLGVVENPVAGQGLQDPFPAANIMSPVYRRLVETRQAALMGRTLPFAMTWNDIAYGMRMVYAKGNQLGTKLPSNLLLAYSAAAKTAYTKDNTFGSQATTDTDVTGKTLTGSASQVIGTERWGWGTVTVPTTQVDNCVWLFSYHGEALAAAAANAFLYLRRTDASNWMRLSRSTNDIKLEKDVATVITTERTAAIPATESMAGFCLAVRINGTVCQLFCNGTKYDEFTLSAGAQGLTGTLTGFSDLTSRVGLGEIEVWSTNAPV